MEENAGGDATSLSVSACYGSNSNESPVKPIPSNQHVQVSCIEYTRTNHAPYVLLVDCWIVQGIKIYGTPVETTNMKDWKKNPDVGMPQG